MIQCIYPWSSLSIRPNNQCGICFASHKTYFTLGDKTVLNDLHNHPDRIKHRESMLNNTSVDDGYCERCCEYQCCNQTTLNNKIKEQGMIPLYKEIQDKKVYLENPPEMIDVCIDNICNYDCDMCYNKKTKFKIKDSFFRILCEINEKSKHLFRVVWIGGEVFASEFSKEMLIKSSQENSNMTVCLLTNGALYDEGVLEKCKLDNVTISIDSHLMKTYSQIRKNGNLMNVLINMSNYISFREKNKLSFPITVTCVITMENYNQINDIIEFYSKFQNINLHFRNGMIRDNPCDVFYMSRKNPILFRSFEKILLSSIENENINKFEKPKNTIDSLNTLIRNLYNYQIKEHGKDGMDKLWI